MSDDNDFASSVLHRLLRSQQQILKDWETMLQNDSTSQTFVDLFTQITKASMAAQLGMLRAVRENRKAFAELPLQLIRPYRQCIDATLNQQRGSEKDEQTKEQ